ncbi:MAG: ATP-binding protein [Alphaproteobacteria bacterium]|nr:ATP-binding protein [Alphaproteobacteria bacterium]
MEFIGRTKELSDLEQEYNSKHSFVVLYGRRRIGKTALIQEFIKDKPALYFLATEESEPQSMKRFASNLSQFAQQEFIAKANFNDWIDLFKVFVDVPSNKTKVLVIDEFQYIVNTNPAFTSIFQKVWDEILSKQNVMVIICGSYINMMTKQVLSENSPLYGRRTSQIRLAPLTFSEIRNHFSYKSFSDVVELYSVIGGVPKYLEFFDNDSELMYNISRVILNKNGFLYEEPAFLLNKEIKEPVNYYSVMKAIAQNNHKLSEISSTMSTEGNKLSPYLETLMGLFLLEKRVPVTEKKPEKSRKGLYYIKDIFIRFWFMFVFPYKGELELDNISFVKDKLSTNFIDNHVAFVYEEVCKNIFTELCRNKQINFTPSRIGSYWDKNVEIDLVAVDESNKCIFAAECKYYNDTKPVDVNVYAKLVEKCKVNDFRGYDITYGIFSKSGFTEHLLDIAKKNSNIILINEDKILDTI